MWNFGLWFVKCINFIVNVILFCAIIVILGYCGFVIYDNNNISSSASSSEYSVYKPTENNIVSFEELKSINAEVIGWLTLDNTGVDYPITQGTDNIKYVNTNVEGEYSLAGSLFLDYRNSIDKLDTVSIIYGHDMDGGAMFGGLREYRSLDYMLKHSSGSILLGDDLYSIKVVAFMSVDAYDMEVYSVVENNSLEYINRVKDKVTVDGGISEIVQKDKLLLLSTCSNEGTNGRWVVLCVIEGNY